MIAVLDTNVFVSGYISTKGAPFEIIDAWLQKRFQLLVSDQILEEYARVFELIDYAPFNKMTARDLQELMNNIRSHSTTVEVLVEHDYIVADPSDSKFIDCAIVGGAECLVTGDRKHFTQKEYSGVHVFSPREFVTILNY